MFIFKLSVLGFCLFPFNLLGFAPTAVPPMLPFASTSLRPLPLSGSPSLPLSFVCFRLGLTTQPSVLSFPCFPFSPVGGSFGAARFLASPPLSSSVRPVAMPLFRFRYSAFCCSFLRSPARLTVLPQLLDLILSVSAAPLGFPFRFGYSAWMSSVEGHPFASDVTSAANFDILTRLPSFVNTFFQNYSTNFIFLFYALPQGHLSSTKLIY